MLSSAAALLDGLFEQPAREMSISVRRSLRNSLMAVTMMMVAVLPVSVQADSPKKHRGPCEIHYPSDATVEWDCRVILPGESLETIFGDYWVEAARFNRIDRRHARLASQSKCRGGSRVWRSLLRYRCSIRQESWRSNSF